MTTKLKILLVVSVTLFLASLTEAGSNIGCGFLKPLSAILFIVFFIGQLLHDEVVKYDKECRLRLASARAQSPSSPNWDKVVSSALTESRNDARLPAAHLEPFRS